MPSLLQQLENNEAVLMMYLADELTAEDRSEVEQMLATDGGMRAELAELKAAQRAADSAFLSLDRGDPLPSAQTTVNRLGRRFRQWHVDRMMAPPVTQPRRRQIKITWWMSTAASVAAVIVIMLFWWGMSPENVESKPAVAEAVNQWEVREINMRTVISLRDDVLTDASVADAERQAMTIAQRDADTDEDATAQQTPPQ